MTADAKATDILVYQLRALRTTFGPGALSKDFLDNAANELEALQDKLTKAVKALEQCATPFTLPNIDDLSGDAPEKAVAVFRHLVEHALAIQTAANTALRSIKESEHG